MERRLDNPVRFLVEMNKNFIYSDPEKSAFYAYARNTTEQFIDLFQQGRESEIKALYESSHPARDDHGTAFCEVIKFIQEYLETIA